VLYKNGHLHGILKCHASLKPSDFLLSVVYNSDAGEKVGDFHVSFKDRKTRKKFHEIKFKDTKEKSNVSNAIVSLASSTDCIRIYRKELRPSKLKTYAHKYNLRLMVVQ
jgi:hypothetical protein